MIKSILVFSLLLNFLFSFSSNTKIEESPELLVNNDIYCNPSDSIVNVTTSSNYFNGSGVIIETTNNKVYIVTSYAYYDKNFNYEIIFNDYSRHKAKVTGVAVEDEIFILEVETINNYCPAKLSKSKYIDKGELVDILGKYDYKTVQTKTNINEIGVCKNCNEETYKNYFYTLLTLDMPSYFNGAGVFDKKGQLLGVITNRVDQYRYGVSVLDVDKLYAISVNLIKYGKYEKNYIKYNLLNVYSLTNYEKYLYSLDEEITRGVLVSSVHYLNYLFGGLNQGMIILKVNGINVDNVYELDNEFAKYKSNSTVKLTVRKISGRITTYKVKL